MVVAPLVSEAVGTLALALAEHQRVAWEASGESQHPNLMPQLPLRIPQGWTGRQKDADGR